MYIIESERLGFRLWKDEDRAPFAKMNADPQVMKYFPSVLTKEQSDQFVDRITKHFQHCGFGLWAVETKDARDFIGFIGFYTATFEAAFTPCVEIGWRLSNRFWNKGYASEGASRCLHYGFDVLDLDEIYSFTSTLNKASIRVMQKIQLREHDHFDHPNIACGNPLRPHILYKTDKEEFQRMSVKKAAGGYE